MSNGQVATKTRFFDANAIILDTVLVHVTTCTKSVWRYLNFTILFLQLECDRKIIDFFL